LATRRITADEEEMTSLAGPEALHFATEDGSVLAPPQLQGDAVAGTVDGEWS
jgi:hypothetical protein